jgi:hypothetical protein
MQVKFVYTPQIMQRAFELHAKKRFVLGGKWMLVFGLLTVWAGLLLLLVYFYSKAPAYPYAFIGFGFSMIAVHFIVLKTQGARLFKQIKKDAIQYDINEDGIYFILKNGKSFKPWAEFIQAFYNQKIVLLYTEKYSYYIFPKEIFHGQEFEQFKSIVRERVVTKKIISGKQ